MSRRQDLLAEIKELEASVERAERRLDTARKSVLRQDQQAALLAWDLTPPTALDEVEDPRTHRLPPSLGHAARWHKRSYGRRDGLARKFREPISDLYLKSDARDFAEAHGVGVPAILAEWDTPGDIEWESLPDMFVLKSTTGGGGISVFPLTRQGDLFFDAITSTTVTREDVVAQLWHKHREGMSSYFVEEFLTRIDGKPGSPHDIKVFCFYGEPAFIEMRTEDWSRFKDAKVRTRTFLLDGTELYDIRPFVGQGVDLDAPRDLAAIVTASRALSKAIRRPIVRLDFFESEQGLKFGEVTQHPGRLPLFVPEWDEHFGDLYESGFARMLSDLLDEGELRVVPGTAGTVEP